MQSEYELAFQDNAFFSLPFLHALKRDLDMAFDMDHEEVVHEMVHLIEIERLSRGKKLYRFGDEENGGSLFDRVQHEIYNQQKVADAIQAFYEDEDSPTLANLHELHVSAIVLRAFKKMFGKNDVSYVNLEIATIERCEANMWGMQEWEWKERYGWVREQFEKYMTSFSAGKLVDELANELMRLHDTWAKSGKIDWEGRLRMNEQDRYNVAYIAGMFDDIHRELRKVGSKWKCPAIPYAIHNTQSWFIVAHDSYPVAGSHFARFKNLEHAIRLVIWLTKKLGSEKNASGVMFHWEWEKVAGQRAPEPPKMPEHEIALRNELADYKKDLSIVSARLREADEKIKSLTLSLSAATSKGDKLAEMQKRLVELEEQNTRLIDESSRGYR